ncbi:MAG: fibronectin type III domain-containing protein [Nitrospirae bacterium]|nr:fibronectin type III domain-containing protein [Nitrospirota bacterium]
MMMLICTNSFVFAADAVLSWDPNTEPDLAGYKVYYGTVSGAHTQVISVGLTSTPTAPQYTVSNLNSGTTYYFSVTSFDSSSNESGFSNEVSKTFPAEATTPMDITDFIVVPGKGQISLSWNDPSDPNYAGVRIRVRTDGTYPTDPNNDGDLVGDFPGEPLQSKSYVHSDLKAGTAYYYSAFSQDSSGNFTPAVHATATPLASDQPNRGLSSQNISGGCGMVRPGNGKPPGPGQAADIMALLVLILVTLVRKWTRPKNFIQWVAASFLNPVLKFHGIYFLGAFLFTTAFLSLYPNGAEAQTANITVDAAAGQGTLVQHSLNINQDPTVAREQQRVADVGMRMIRNHTQTDITNLEYVSTAEGQYDWTSLDASMDSVIASGAKPYFRLGYMPDWLADKSYGITNSSDPNHLYKFNPPSDFAKWQQLVYDVVYHLNVVKKYGITFFTVWNEPDCCGSLYLTGQSGYFQLYKYAAQGVKSADPSAKVGGPVASWLTSGFTQGLITYCAANSVPLDFIDFHWYDPSPGTLAPLLSTARTWLNGAGFSTAPIFVSEWNGSYTWTDSGAVTRQAGHIAPVAYYLTEAGADGFFWRLLRPSPSTSGIIQNGGDPVYPQYNTYKMISMLASTRVSTTGLQMDSNGLGVGAISSMDAGKVTVLIWNYQNTGTSAFTVNVTVNNLPSSFSGKSIQLARYLMDATHSNYTYSTSNYELEQVENLTLSPASSLTKSVGLPASAVSLIALTPGGTASDTTPPAPPTGLTVK